MSWLFWTRFEWATWQWHHPWSVAIPPTVLLIGWTNSKIKER